MALYQACVVEKDFAKGRRIMAAMMPLMDFLEGGKFVQSIKYGCALNGLSTGGVRKPLYDLDAAEKQELQRVVSELKRNIAQITGGA
ncbi:5-dehydro-4-deoxyglucarate dehydratase [compost metagenome]